MAWQGMAWAQAALTLALALAALAYPAHRALGAAVKDEAEATRATAMRILVTRIMRMSDTVVGGLRASRPSGVWSAR